VDGLQLVQEQRRHLLRCLRLAAGLYLGNYQTVFSEGAMGTYFKNSLLISVTSVAGLLAFSALAAYAFATFEFRAKNVLFVVFSSA
jgi:ABC-type glycerol-3-phosphate transport system permease component